MEPLNLGVLSLSSLYCLTVRGVQVQQTVIQQHNSHAHAGVMAPLPTVAVCNSVLHPPFGKTALPRLMLGLSRFRHTRICAYGQIRCVASWAVGCDSYQSESLGGTVPSPAVTNQRHLMKRPDRRMIGNCLIDRFGLRHFASGGVLFIAAPACA